MNERQSTMPPLVDMPAVSDRSTTLPGKTRRAFVAAGTALALTSPALLATGCEEPANPYRTEMNRQWDGYALQGRPFDKTKFKLVYKKRRVFNSNPIYPVVPAALRKDIDKARSEYLKGDIITDKMEAHIICTLAGLNRVKTLPMASLKGAAREYRAGLKEEKVRKAQGKISENGAHYERAHRQCGQLLERSAFGFRGGSYVVTFEVNKPPAVRPKTHN